MLEVIKSAKFTGRIKIKTGVWYVQSDPTKRQKANTTNLIKRRFFRTITNIKTALLSDILSKNRLFIKFDRIFWFSMHCKIKTSVTSSIIVAMPVVSCNNYSFGRGRIIYFSLLNAPRWKKSSSPSWASVSLKLQFNRCSGQPEKLWTPTISGHHSRYPKFVIFFDYSELVSAI